MVSEALLAIALQLHPGSLVPLYQQALTERERQFGPEHPKVARSAADLGLYLRNVGARSGAVPYFERALAIDTKMLSPSDSHCRDLESLASVVSSGGPLAVT